MQIFKLNLEGKFLIYLKENYYLKNVSFDLRFTTLNILCKRVNKLKQTENKNE
jgi:hypothetical protein